MTPGCVVTDKAVFADRSWIMSRSRPVWENEDAISGKIRYARTCSGHPRAEQPAQRAGPIAWMAGTGPAMTSRLTDR